VDSIDPFDGFRDCPPCVDRDVGGFDREGGRPAALFVLVPLGGDGSCASAASLFVLEDTEAELLVNCRLRFR